MTDWQYSIGRYTAQEMASTEWWVGKSANEIVSVQLFIAELCMPFDRFHAAVEEALGRSVWTHEFGMSLDRIKDEFLGNCDAPTMKQIVSLLPADKSIVMVERK